MFALSLSEGSIFEIPTEKGVFYLNFCTDKRFHLSCAWLEEQTFTSAEVHFDNDIKDCIMIVEWQENIIQVSLNTTLVGSNDPSLAKTLPSLINIQTKIRDFHADTQSFQKQNVDALQKRIKDSNTINVPAGAQEISLQERINHLKNELILINEYILNIKTGKHLFWMPLSVSLRKLICTFESPPSYPLLQRIAGKLGAPLIVYTNPSEVKGLTDSNVFYCDISISTTPTNIAPTQVDLDCWLELKHVVFQGTNGKFIHITNNEFIKHLCNKQACHVDDSLFYQADLLTSIRVSDSDGYRSVYTEYMIQIARVVLGLSGKLIDDYNP